MKRLLVATLLLLPLTGAAVAETLRVEALAVDRVSIYGSVEVEISQGEPTLLLVRGDEASLEQKPFHVRGSTLVLGMSEKGNPDDRNFSDLKFKVTLPELQNIKLSGSGDVYVKPFSVTELTIVLSGSGDMNFFELSGGSVTVAATGSGDVQLAKLRLDSVELVQTGSGDIVLGELDTTALSASVNGSGDISVDGSAKSNELKLNIVGSGDIDLAAIDSGNAEVNIVGSGTAQLGVSSTLSVTIMGSGEVQHKGSPEIDQTILGSGSVRGANQ